jgi:hypothetical protein
MKVFHKWFSSFLRGVRRNWSQSQSVLHSNDHRKAHSLAWYRDGSIRSPLNRVKLLGFGGISWLLTLMASVLSDWSYRKAIHFYSTPWRYRFYSIFWWLHKSGLYFHALDFFVLRFLFELIQPDLLRTLTFSWSLQLLSLLLVDVLLSLLYRSLPHQSSILLRRCFT